MQPLLTSVQIRNADKFTITHEPISSLGLMERAAKAFVNEFNKHFPDKAKTITVYCGTGNNGGDGLTIARLLTNNGYLNIGICVARFSKKTSADFDANLAKLGTSEIQVNEFYTAADVPDIDGDIIIDALLGTGLNKPLKGEFAKLVEKIDNSGKIIVAVDIPSGLFSDGEVDKDALTIKSNLTITFQQPKLSFLLPESLKAVKRWVAVNIGIDGNYLSSLKSPYQFVEEQDIINFLKPRENFSNKGTYGHALIIAGQPETMGAALLCSAACAHAGAGLTTACVPENGLTALNSYQPEVMAIIREEDYLSEIKWDKFTAAAIGPGLGQDDYALQLLDSLINNYKQPLVADADALNLLGSNKALLSKIPPNSILTPHVKEFDRLFGEHKSWWQRLQTGIEQSKALNVYIVLKNDYTITISPDGMCYFNSTSNAAMATGGMGDVLTGIITALLAQGYSSREACLAGVYVHGKAGDNLALPDKKIVVLPGEVLKEVPVIMAILLKKRLNR